jgi:hypothetical protein
VPRELVGHVAGLDPSQFAALARMPKDAIAKLVRDLPGMDDQNAKDFGDAIEALPPDALPLLSQMIPAEARQFLGARS